MVVATFDTLKFANTLKDAGVPSQQAEAQARAFADVIQLNFQGLATKDDLAAQGKDFKHEIKEVGQRLNAKIDNAVTKIDGNFTLLKWMIGANATGTLFTLGLVLRYFVFRGVP